MFEMKELFKSINSVTNTERLGIFTLPDRCRGFLVTFYATENGY